MARRKKVRIIRKRPSGGGGGPGPRSGPSGAGPALLLISKEPLSWDLAEEDYEKRSDDEDEDSPGKWAESEQSKMKKNFEPFYEIIARLRGANLNTTLSEFGGKSQVGGDALWARIKENLSRWVEGLVLHHRRVGGSMYRHALVLDLTRKGCRLEPSAWALIHYLSLYATFPKEQVVAFIVSGQRFKELMDSTGFSSSWPIFQRRFDHDGSDPKDMDLRTVFNAEANTLAANAVLLPVLEKVTSTYFEDNSQEDLLQGSVMRDILVERQAMQVGEKLHRRRAGVDADDFVPTMPSAEAVAENVNAIRDKAGAVIDKLLKVTDQLRETLTDHDKETGKEEKKKLRKAFVRQAKKEGLLPESPSKGDVNSLMARLRQENERAAGG